MKPIKNLQDALMKRQKRKDFVRKSKTERTEKLLKAFNDFRKPKLDYKGKKLDYKAKTIKTREMGKTIRHLATQQAAKSIIRENSANNASNINTALNQEVQRSQNQDSGSGGSAKRNLTDEDSVDSTYGIGNRV